MLAAAVLANAKCREAGSAEIELETLKLSWLGLERAATHGNAPDTYRPLADAVMGLIQRLRALAGAAAPGFWRESAFEAAEHVWSGREVRGRLLAARSQGQGVSRSLPLMRTCRASPGQGLLCGSLAAQEACGLAPSTRLLHAPSNPPADGGAGGRGPGPQRRATPASAVLHALLTPGVPRVD